MENNWKDIIGAASGDEAHVLGKFLYFSLASVLVDKQEFADLCKHILGIDYKSWSRLSVADAFREDKLLRIGKAFEDIVPPVRG